MNSLTTKEYWDKCYEGLNFDFAAEDDQLKNWFIKHFKPIKNQNKRAIEVGCFPGRYLAEFGKLGYEVNGIDITPGVVEILPKTYSEIGFKVGNFINEDFLEYKSHEKYDVVCSFGFIEHFINWQDVLKKHAGMVNDDGYLIITAPNFYGLVQRFLHYYLDRDNYNKHNISSMRPDLWKKILEKEGFEILESGYWGEFQFWVDAQDRNYFQRKLLKEVFKRHDFLSKVLPENNKLYSPIAGIIARKKS